jgi:hypothetical protein
LAKFQVFTEPPPPKRPNPPNPPPVKRAAHTADSNGSLSVLVLDLDNKPAPHHCLLKNQWMTPFLEQNWIENVDIYSLSSWKHPACDLHALFVPPSPRHYVDPSAWLFVKSLQTALNRTTSAWFYIVGDSVYIRPEPFYDFFQTRINHTNGHTQVAMNGGCIEKRYFFQMFVLDSGIFMSRAAAQRLVDPERLEVWDVAMEAGIHYDEILAHLSDEIGVGLRGSSNDQFVGRTFRNVSDFDILRKKDFDTLAPCMVPREYLMLRPGELGLCSSRITKFNSVFAWSAAHTIGKVEFLAEAEKLLAGNPDDLGYFWDLTKPKLCKITAGSEQSTRYNPWFW